jgi:hypothetical protein
VSRGLFPNKLSLVINLGCTTPNSDLEKLLALLFWDLSIKARAASVDVMMKEKMIFMT